jgi:hypothetical protein
MKDPLGNILEIDSHGYGLTYAAGAYQSPRGIAAVHESGKENTVDAKVAEVLAHYYGQIREDRSAPRVETPGGRDGGATLSSSITSMACCCPT